MFISFSKVNIQGFSKCRLLQDCSMGERVKEDLSQLQMFVFIFSEYYFLTPFMENGSLNHAIENDNNLTDGEPPMIKAFDRLRIMFQIASAIHFLHTPVPDIR